MNRGRKCNRLKHSTSSECKAKRNQLDFNKNEIGVNEEDKGDWRSVK